MLKPSIYKLSKKLALTKGDQWQQTLIIALTKKSFPSTEYGTAVNMEGCQDQHNHAN